MCLLPSVVRWAAPITPERLAAAALRLDSEAASPGPRAKRRCTAADVGSSFFDEEAGNSTGLGRLVPVPGARARWRLELDRCDLSQLMGRDHVATIAALRRATDGGRRPIVLSGDSVMRQLFGRFLRALRGPRLEGERLEPIYEVPGLGWNDYAYVVRRHTDEWRTIKTNTMGERPGQRPGHPVSNRGGRSALPGPPMQGGPKSSRGRHTRRPAAELDAPHDADHLATPVPPVVAHGLPPKADADGTDDAAAQAQSRRLLGKGEERRQVEPRPYCAEGVCIDDVKSVTSPVSCDPDDADDPCLLRVQFHFFGQDRKFRESDISRIGAVVQQSPSALAQPDGEKRSCRTGGTASLASGLRYDDVPAWHFHGFFYWALFRDLGGNLRLGADRGAGSMQVITGKAMRTFRSVRNNLARPGRCTQDRPGAEAAVSVAGPPPPYRFVHMAAPPIRRAAEQKFIPALDTRNRLMKSSAKATADLRANGTLGSAPDYFMPVDAVIDWGGLVRPLPLGFEPSGPDGLHWMCGASIIFSNPESTIRSPVRGDPSGCSGDIDGAAIQLMLEHLRASGATSSEAVPTV
jgi:hypothetical protein